MFDPIEERWRAQMNGVAQALDRTFNGNKTGHDRKVCFVLLISEFGESGCASYISNGERADIVEMMKEMIARYERDDVMGHA